MSDHWHDCRRCSGQQQCNCDAPTEPQLCDGCARKIAERVWLKAKVWAEARKKEDDASEARARAECELLRIGPWDSSLKDAYLRAYGKWEQANKALCEAEEALAREVEQ